MARCRLPMIICLLVIVVTWIGCIDGRLTDGDAASDAGPSAEEVLGACEQSRCKPGAECRDGMCVCEDGYTPGPAGGCIPESEPVCSEPCGAGGRCIDDACRCDPDYFSDGDGCRRTEPSDPAERTSSRVCERWLDQRPSLDGGLWAETPAERCDLGRLAPTTQRHALQYLNLYRWFVGVGPVTAHPAYIDRAQACATTLAAEGAGVTHTIDSSFECYSRRAEEGARSSNVARGIEHPAESIALYVRDRGSAALGHRRWVFNPSMEWTGFGQRGDYSCMYAVDEHRDADNTDIYYPPPGYLPAAAFDGTWSFMASDLAVTEAADVEITAPDSGDTVAVEDLRVAPGDYAGLATLVWKAPDVTPETEYRVAITGLGADAETSRIYRTTLVECE